MAKRKSKYNSVKTERTIGGEVVTFDSKKEASRFDELALLQRAGKIHALTLQPSYLILDKVKHEGHRAMSSRYYVADFRYIDEVGQLIVEDVKGFKTAMYNLKKQMFLKIYGHELIFKET